MKKLLAVIGVAALLATATTRAQTVTVTTNASGGQTFETNAPSPQQFTATALNYFTSFNTNLASTFQNRHGSAWAGADYQSGLNADSVIACDYNLWKIIAVEALVRNGGIAGTLVSAQGGVGVKLTVIDAEFSGWLDGGYSFYRNSGFVAAAAEAKKALTQNTFMGARLEEQFYSRKPEPPLATVFCGFCF